MLYENRILADKFVNGVTLFSANPTWIDVVSNSSLRCEDGE
jgi:hypothetical protein